MTFEGFDIPFESICSPHVMGSDRNMNTMYGSLKKC